MSDITLYLNDYSILNIDCEPGISAELNDHFAFFVPGHQYMPLFKRKVWDGKIRLYNLINGQLPAGLYRDVIDFAKKRNYSCNAVQNEYGHPGQIDTTKYDQTVAEYLKEHDVPLPWEPRDYQHTAVEYCRKNRRGIILSPTATGKSYMIYLISKYLLLNNPDFKVLILCSITSLVEQMAKDLSDYGCSKNDLEKIYSGLERNPNANITISTWQSIYKKPKEWFQQYDVVIGDECHEFMAKSLTTIMEKSTNAQYRFGFSGTLDDSKSMEISLRGLFGDIFIPTTTKKEQKKKTISDLEIDCIIFKHNKENVKKYKEETKDLKTTFKYQAEIKYLTKHDKRNKLISNLAVQQRGNTLVLFNHIAHGKELFKRIDEESGPDRKVYLIYGGVDVNDREEIRRLVDTLSNAIIVASFKTFSTGINIVNLRNLILASPIKAKIKLLQSIGRTLRKSADGHTSRLFDLSDNITNHNTTMMHAAKRLKIYDSEKFEYKIHKVDL